MATFFYRMPDGTLGSISSTMAVPDQAARGVTAFAAETTLPPELEGAELLTKAEYDAALAGIKASAEEAASELAEAEEAFNRRKSGGATRIVVAAATAPRHVRDGAAYICDGTDDQVQINAAINEAFLTGVMSVHLSAGTFHLGDSVRIPTGQGLTFSGEGWGTVLKNAPTTNRYAVVFDSSGETRATFRDLKIDGSSLDQSSGGGCVWAPGAVQCRFENIHFAGFWDTGLYLGPMSGGIFGHHNKVTNCLFDGSMHSPGAGTAIHMTSSDENWITDCDVEFCGGATGQAAAVYDQAGTNAIRGLNVVGGRPGIPAVRLKDCHRTRIQGSNFDGVGGDGVFVTGSGHIVSGNVFSAVGVGAPAGTVTGVHLEFAATRNIVSGNVLTTAEANGVSNSLIREDSDGGTGLNVITGNQLIEVGTAAFGLLTLGGNGSVARDNMGVADTIPIP